MSTDFQMNYHHNKDNLHVKMQGIFDGNSAHELLNLFLREYRCGGRVFVDTAGVSEVLPFGSKVLQARLCQTPRSWRRSCSSRAKTDSTWRPPGAVCLFVPPRKKKSGCCGKCAHCTCHGEHGHGHRARRMRMSRRTQSRSLTFFQVELFHE